VNDAIPISEAFLCQGCQCVVRVYRGRACPACGSNALMGVWTVLQPFEEQAKRVDPPGLECCVVSRRSTRVRDLAQALAILEVDNILP